MILADTFGRPRILMLVAPDGAPRLDFIGENGAVLQRPPQPTAAR